MFSLKGAFAGPVTWGCCGRCRDARAEGRQLTEDGASKSRALVARFVLLLRSARRCLGTAPLLWLQSGGTSRQPSWVFSTGHQVSRHCHLEGTRRRRRRTAESLRVWFLHPSLRWFISALFLILHRLKEFLHWPSKELHWWGFGLVFFFGVWFCVFFSLVACSRQYWKHWSISRLERGFCILRCMSGQHPNGGICCVCVLFAVLDKARRCVGWKPAENPAGASQVCFDPSRQLLNFSSF